MHQPAVNFLDQRAHDTLADGRGSVQGRLVGGFEFGDDAHDLARRDAATLARETITAAGAAHALQNAGAHEGLHHLLEIAMGHALAAGDFLRLHGFGARVAGDVDHRLER